MARNTAHKIDYGIVKYNDFTFPPALNASAQVSPIYDDSERGLMYVKYLIKIEFIICLDDVGELGEPSPENSTYKPNSSSPSSNADGPVGGSLASKGSIDPQIAHLRRQLMQPGRHLEMRDVGLGYDLNVNDPTERYTGLHDVAWGPKPINLSWESIASNRAARVVWEVEVALPECEDYGSRAKEDWPQIFGRPETGGALPVEVTQIVYNVSWDIDIYGKTTKQYQAVLQIRGSVDVGNLTEILRSSDEYRQYFEPPILNGYIRNRSYALNDSKTRLTINITDTQHASDFSLPPGTPDIEVDYSISSGLRGKSQLNMGAEFTGWQIWSASLSGRMTLAKGFDPKYRRIYPYFVFLLIIRSRFTFLKSGAGDQAATTETYDIFGGGHYDTNASIRKGITSLPVSFEMGESVFGMEFTFSMQWEVINLASRAAPFFLRFGCPPNVLWKNQYKANPPKFWTWDLWKKSMYWDRDNEGWNLDIGVMVPSPPSGYGFASGDEHRLTILKDWGIKRAPFSMSGADNLRFEGDARMEPCQPTPDFWYSQTQGTFSGTAPEKYSEIMATQIDNDRRVIWTKSSMETIVGTQNIANVPLDNYNDPTYIGESQEGNSKRMGSVRLKLGYPEGVGTGAATPGNTKGGSRSSQDPIGQVIYPGGLKAAKLQSGGPPFYLVRATGEALTAGLPLNAPRTMRWGKGYAVVQKKRVQTSRICRGEVELWKTRWDITYLILGSPNGWMAPNNPSNLAHNESQIGTNSTEVFRQFT